MIKQLTTKLKQCKIMLIEFINKPKVYNESIRRK